MSINRREFVGAGAAAGLTALTGTTPSLPNPFAEQPSRFELEEITIPQLQEGMASGKYTARSLAQAYLARIDQMDRNGPKVNSVIETNPDALSIADALDRERRERGPRGPLHGIPLLIKDNIDTADRMRTSAGSLALANVSAPRDAFVVQRLRAAGAVILGKTNLSEWANWRSGRSVAGWSGRGGQTRNPYALDRNPSGSSAGTGASIASNFAAVGIGTETDGSIVSPASVNGLVGIKPTVGLVSRTGIIPLAQTFDTAGPMARSVTDAAILLGAMVEVDADDPASSASDGKGYTDYRRYLRADGLRGARIGVARNLGWRDERGMRVLNDAVAAMRAAGAVIVDPANFPTAGRLGSAKVEVMATEFKAGINAYLATSASPLKSLTALIEFNNRNREREMPYFGQELFMLSERKGPLTSPAYLDAIATCRQLARVEGIDAMLAEHRLDGFVALTGSPAPMTDLIFGGYGGGSSSEPAAVAGYATITVPAGHLFGLPLGVSFVGPAWSEAALIGFAYSFEQATKARKAPRFLPTAEL